MASSCRAKRWKWPALTLSWTCPELVSWQGTDELTAWNFQTVSDCHDVSFHFIHFPWFFIDLFDFHLYWRPLWIDSSKSMLVAMPVGISTILVLTTLQDSLNKRQGSTAVHPSITSPIFSEYRHCSHSYAILDSVYTVDSPSVTISDRPMISNFPRCSQWHQPLDS